MIVLKFPISIGKAVPLDLPMPSQVMAFGIQKGTPYTPYIPYIWVLCPSEWESTQRRHFLCVETGVSFENRIVSVIGTAFEQDSDGSPYVLHAFEVAHS